MRYYELTYLISPELPENQLKELSQKIESFIIQEGGIVGQKTEPAKRKLGYPIERNEAAFLVTLNLNFAPNNLEKLGKFLKGENQILRYIILTKQSPEKMKAKVPRRFLKKTFLVETKRTETPGGLAKPSGSSKIELKEIDKKIEEILNE